MLQSRTRFTLAIIAMLLGGCHDVSPETRVVADKGVAPPGEWQADRNSAADGKAAPAAAAAARVTSERTALAAPALVQQDHLRSEAMDALLGDPAQWDAQVADWQQRYATDATAQHRRQEHLDALKLRLRQATTTSQLQAFDCSPQLCLLGITLMPDDAEAMTHALTDIAPGQPPIYTASVRLQRSGGTTGGAVLYRAIISVDPAIQGYSVQTR
ncbi:hypothetical protein [Stenotrophomonas sp.]|uniref:hypothetical protein n=1 Tax=Stenotrophomonas sp. TaxID=69392 RepID=UPI00289B7297|nr:hypothetical protein [Stenotrophomonas sp.]